MSPNNDIRRQAQAQLEAIKLDAHMTQIIFEYVFAEAFHINNRLSAVVLMKNLIKKAYGQHNFTHYDKATQKRNEDEAVAGDEDDPTNFIDQDGDQMMKGNLVQALMGSTDKRIADIFLEIISLMSKRYVQNDWPNLITELMQNMKSGDLHKIKLALEAIKKICKKYRFMFRSDALYTEMNYMIENLSELLIQNLMTAVNGLSA